MGLCVLIVEVNVKVKEYLKNLVQGIRWMGEEGRRGFECLMISSPGLS